jgi:hypothetical protein
MGVAEPHHFYAAPAPGENFDAASAPTLLYIKTKHFKGIKVNIRSDILFFLLILYNESCRKCE